MSISVFMITYNEAKRIGQTLDCLSWADEIIVVDGCSTDNTVDICRQKGAKTYVQPFEDFAKQKNYALSLTTHEWVLSVDADEEVSPTLQAEIKRVIRREDDCSGYSLHRINFFLGKPLRFGSQRHDYLVRLFKKSKGSFHGSVHETLQLEGRLQSLKGDLYHKSTESLAVYFKKLALYSDLEAKRLVERNRQPSLLKALTFPIAKWILDYLFLGGFLDGKRGFLYHSLSCYHAWIRNFKARSRSVKSS